MKHCCLILLTLALLLSTVGCQKTESTVELYPYTQQTVDKTGLAVNVSTLKIHTDPDCYHVKASQEKNLRYAPDTAETVNTLFSMGYTFCKTCSE